jgi:uncharacterized protein YprB with RNaseH-like and TPR domain
LKAQEFLPVAERAGAIAFVDIEASNLKADFGTVVVVAIKPYKGEVKVFKARPGRDKSLLKRVAKELAKYQLWVTFYGKLFDVPFLNSRLLANRLPPLPKQHHCDLYWVIKGQTALSRRNQGHLLSWLRTPERKMGVSPNVWAELPAVGGNLDVLVERCASDVKGLEALYKKVKHLIGEITR